MKKLTPNEIAAMCEFQYGQPMMAAQPSESPDTYNLPPELINQVSPDIEAEFLTDNLTEMRSCQAVQCIYNCEGSLCSLQAIEVDANGGCAQFELAAPSNNDGGRYAEKEADGPTQPTQSDQQRQVDGERHWDTGRFNPQGSSV